MLHVLLIEDNPGDVLLTQEAIRTVKPGARSREPENTHGAAGILARDLTVNRLVRELYLLVEACFPRRDLESRKHLLAAHLLRPPYVFNGLVDGRNQSLHAGELLLQQRTMRFQRCRLFEIGPA